MTEEQHGEVQRPIPAFEGRVVDGVRVKISGSAPVDDLDEVLSVDDRVLMLAEYRVVGVRHIVDEQTGNLIREHVIKPIRMDLHPWDASDPQDRGIVRAIPGH